MRHAAFGAAYVVALVVVSAPTWLPPGTAKTARGIEQRAAVPRIVVGSLHAAPRLPIALPTAPVDSAGPTSAGVGGTTLTNRTSPPAGVTTQPPKRILDFEQ